MSEGESTELERQTGRQAEERQRRRGREAEAETEGGDQEQPSENENIQLLGIAKWRFTSTCADRDIGSLCGQALSELGGTATLHGMENTVPKRVLSVGGY